MKKVLSVIYSWWMKFARVLGKIQTTVILFVIYFIGVGMTSMISFILRKDFLDKKFVDAESYWRNRTGEASTIENCKRQF